MLLVKIYRYRKYIGQVYIDPRGASPFKLPIKGYVDWDKAFHF